MMSTFAFFRLFVQDNLTQNLCFEPSKEQQHYLLNVLRLKEGQQVYVFNGRDGEWLATLSDVTRKKCMLKVGAQTRPQQGKDSLPLPDIHYLFAPIKRGRLDYMVQKVTEMGVSHIQPAITQHTNIGKIKLSRLEANVIEAAEQCGILRIPTVSEPQSLSAVLDKWDDNRTLVFCDEAEAVSSPLVSLGSLQRHSPLAVLIGPEGGFSEQEATLLRGKEFVLPISLGPRILRADTAAVAALTLMNAALADWV